MSWARQMAFAGWYPEKPTACEAEIVRLLATPLPEWTPPSPLPLFAKDPAPTPVSLGVVPHAGWVYSGALASQVIQQLAIQQPSAELVVVLGGHLRPNDPVVGMLAGAWETPFGPLAVHGAAESMLGRVPGLVQEGRHRFYSDNSVEVHLPLIKHFFPQAEVLTLRVPPAAAMHAVAEALGNLLHVSGLSTVVLASTDLTHYGAPYGFTPKGDGPASLQWVKEENDPAFMAVAQTGEADALVEEAQRRHNACSAGAVGVAALLAQHWGLGVRPLGYHTSADMQPEGGFPPQFVGYWGAVYQPLA